MYAYPAGYVHANTVRGSLVFELDDTLKEPKTVQIACPCKGDYKPPKKVVKRVGKSNYCSCVLTAKAWTGYSRSIGVARNWERNSDVPVIGGVLIENLTNAGHVSLIIGLTNEGIVVKEGNYKRCSLTEGRVVPYDSPTIIGFWSP